LETDALPIELLTCTQVEKWKNGRSGKVTYVTAHSSPATYFSIFPLFNFSTLLLRLFMCRVLAAEAAELAELQPLRRLLLVLRRAVVATLTIAARQMNDVAHLPTPAP
jgi:hypothetical protein